MSKDKKILIITGEASGDLHAANLMREVQALVPAVTFAGMGSYHMQAAGAEIIINNGEPVMGIFEIIRYIPKIYGCYKKLKKIIQEQTFDLIVFVDYPGFNLRLAKVAKQAGKKFLYYISPQVWAWRQWRVKHIKKYIDHMAVILPFEVDFYRKYNMGVHFVGHPLLKHVKVNKDPQEIKKYYQLKEGTKIVGLLPGSRKNEIHYLLPILIETAYKIKTHFPDVQFVLPLAHTLKLNEIKNSLPADLNIKIQTEDHYNVISICDAVIAASGTVTLEITLLETPMVIIYKVNSLSLQIAKRLIKVPYAGLCNIIADKKIVPELLQENATPDNIANEIIQLLEDQPYRETQIHNLRAVKEKLNVQQDYSLGQLIHDMLN